MYWTLKSIPELGGVSRRERGRRWRRAYSKSFRHLTTWIALALPAIGGAFGSYYGQMVGLGSWVGVLGAGIGGFLFAQVSIVLARKRYRQILLGKDTRSSASSNA